MTKSAILFPGQASQYVGMGSTLYRDFAKARKVYEEASDSLGYDVKKLCVEGGLEELTKTENAQPAILTTSIAAYRVLADETGIVVDYMAGHSLGEISALVAAGVISLFDAVRIVRMRGAFMQKETVPGVGAMLAVSNIGVERIQEACQNWSYSGEVVQISNYNSYNQTVISGHKSAVEAVGRDLEARGARCIPLQVSAPFHCALMRPVAERFRTELMNYAFGNFQTSVLSNVTACPYYSRENIVDLLSAQIYRSVNWLASMQFLKQEGVDTVIEVGPNCSLSKLFREDFPSIRSLHMDKCESLSGFFSLVAARSQHREASRYSASGIELIRKCLAIAVCTPNHNSNDVEIQFGSVEAIRGLRQILDQLVQTKKQPEKKEILHSLDLLRRIFLTKKTPIDEQRDRINSLTIDENLWQYFFAEERPGLEV